MNKTLNIICIIASFSLQGVIFTDLEDYVDNVAQPFYVSPITQAIIDGDSGALQTAINQGFDVNQTDDKGQTPLYKAVIVNREDMLRILLEQGADPTIGANNGFIPLSLAAQNGSNNLVNALLENDSTRLQQLNYQVPQPYGTGWTALHIALFKGNDDTVELLLSQGANPNIQTYDGYDALAFARLYNIASGAAIIEKYSR